MLFKSDNLKKSDSKCDLMEEKRDSIEVDNLDLVEPKREIRKWRIFSIALLSVVLALVTTLALAYWTIPIHKYRLLTISSHKIDDEIFQTTMRLSGEAEAILQEIRQNASHMNRANREAAHRFFLKIWHAVQEHRSLGLRIVNRIIEKGINEVKIEFQTLETASQDATNRLVDSARKDIDRITDTLSSVDEENLGSTLEEVVSKAIETIRTMWYELDHMYSHYTFDSSEVIGNKVENMTDRIIHLMSPEREYRDPKMRYEHAKMCYNISLANIETSKTIQKVVQLMDKVYNTTNTVRTLQQSMVYADDRGSDEHAKTAIQESTLLLDKYQKISMDELNGLLQDHYYFLGSAIRVQTDIMYPQCKRFVIGAWKAALRNATEIFTSTASNRLLMKDEYQTNILGGAEDSLRKLGERIETKAALLADESARSRFIEMAKFHQLSTLMEKRFRNATQVINSLYTSGLSSITQALRFDVEFIVDQKVPFLSTLTDQIFLPTDVCPVAMEFADYMTRLINDSMNRDGIDELDHLLPSDGNALANENRPLIDGSVRPKFLNNLNLKNVIYL